jgi:hypothetical protein
MRCSRATGPTALMLAIAAFLQAACGGAGAYPGLTLVGDDWVQRLCKAIKRDCLQVDEINRNSDGRELRVVFRDELVAVSPAGEARTYRKPGAVAWMNDDHEWVASSDDLKHGFYVHTEPSPTYVRGYPKFDAGGRFFAVAEGTSTHLYRVKPYRDEATLPLDFVSGVFSRPSMVFVVGSDRDRRRLHVYTYRSTDEGVEFVTSRTIERPDGGASSPFYVTDVTATGELYAIHDVSDPARESVSTVRVYESAAGRLQSIKTTTLPWATLFLSDELRQRVNSKARFTLMPATAAASRN